MEVKFVDGLRVSDAETVEVAKMVLLGKINSDIVQRLNRAGSARGRALGRGRHPVRDQARRRGREGRLRRRDRAGRRRRPQPHRLRLHPGDRLRRHRPRRQLLQRQRRRGRRRGRGGPARLQGDLPDRRRGLARAMPTTRLADLAGQRRRGRRRARRPSTAACGRSSPPASRRSRAASAPLTSSTAAARTACCSSSSPMPASARWSRRDGGDRRAAERSRGATRCRPTRGRRSSSSAARAVGSGTPRGGSTSTCSRASRSTTRVTATRRSSRRSASRPAARRHLEPLLLGAGDAPGRAAGRVDARRPRLPLQLRRRGERVRDQAGPPPRPRPRHRQSPRSSSSTTASTAARWRRWRRPRGSPARISSGRCHAGFVVGPARRSRRALRGGGRREHRGGDDRADPG